MILWRIKPGDSTRLEEQAQRQHFKDVFQRIYCFIRQVVVEMNKYFPIFFVLVQSVFEGGRHERAQGEGVANDTPVVSTSEGRGKIITVMGGRKFEV